MVLHVFTAVKIVKEVDDGVDLNEWQVIKELDYPFLSKDMGTQKA